MKYLGASLPPFAVLQIYFYLISHASLPIADELMFKAMSVAVVVTLANGGQAVILRGTTSPTWQQLLRINFFIWFFFFFFFTIDAFTVHRGLAKDVDRTMMNLLVKWVIYLGLMGLPLTLFNTLVMKMAVKWGLMEFFLKARDSRI